MTFKEYKSKFVSALCAIYGEMETQQFFYLILESFHGLKRIDLALDPLKALSDADLPKWNAAIDKLKVEIPIQYILGRTEFFGLEFRVNEHVLIPRPETEELVQWILSNTSAEKPLEILDIGTGSGCIAISLAKNLINSNVAAIDISQNAIEIAIGNANRNKANVTFLHKDILSCEHLDQQFDVIVSNPPYVRHQEKTEMNKNVIENEPHLALFVPDDDALVFYKKIASLAKRHLNEQGELYFEINQYLAKETMDLLETIGFSQIELRKDIYGNDRMIYAKK